MSERLWVLVHTVPWGVVLGFLIAILRELSSHRKVLLDVKLQLNGNDSHQKDVPGTQRASRESGGRPGADPGLPDPPV